MVTVHDSLYFWLCDDCVYDQVEELMTLDYMFMSTHLILNFCHSVERRLGQDKSPDDQIDVEILTDLQQKQTRDAHVFASLITNKVGELLLLYWNKHIVYTII